MAQTGQAKVVSQYPLPPKQYYQSSATSTHPSTPPPPAQGSYSMFGRLYTTEDVLPSLEEAGRKRVYDPSANPCTELHRMNKELLQLFMKLMDGLCSALSPEENEHPHQQLIQEIEDTFVNMQHVINVMRPTQAAMDLKVLLDKQTSVRKETTEKLNESVEKAWASIRDASEKLSEPAQELSKEAQDPMKVEIGTKEKEKKNGDKEEKKSLETILAEIEQVVADPTL